MGCTGQKFICYNTKRKRVISKNSNNEINNLQNNNNINQIKEDTQKNIKIEEELINKEELKEINNNIEENKNIINNEVEEDSKDSEDYNYSIPLGNLEMYRSLSPYLQTKNNPNFNFPEVEGDKYVGKGLRRMKGYISKIPKDELEKRRIAFWGTRVEGNAQVWDFLKELCELPIGEEKNMTAMLEANEITPLLGCINVTYDKSGEIYEIPNYCINDPVLYDLPETHVKKPKIKEISFFARKGAKQINIKLSNNCLVEKLKENISENFEIKIENVRIFFGGKELKNGNELWMYKISDDCVIIIL